MAYTTAELVFLCKCPAEKCYQTGPAEGTTREKAWAALLEHLEKAHPYLIQHRIVREEVYDFAQAKA